MLELVENATDYILVDSFLTVHDPETDPVIEALRRRHDEGVRVYLIADSCSRFIPASKSPYKFLKRAGVPNAEFNPIRFHKLVVAPVMLPRDHRKFWVVDGRILFLGGANIYRTSLKHADNGGNIDFMVAVESRDAVARMIESFVATWNESSSRKLHPEEFEVRARPLKKGSLWLADQNKEVGREGEIGRMYAGLFAVARKEIWLIQPYTFMTSDMVDQFRELTERGVQVNLMLSEQVHAPQFHYASRYGLKKILATGAKVWTVKNGYGALHAKAVFVDDDIVSVGSANFNARSYHLSKEANLIFGDRWSVRELRKSLEELKKKCRPIGMDEARKYRTPDYFFFWVIMQVMG